MGANNTKAIYLCETIFPSPDGSSIIPPEKLQKAIAKGEIVLPNTDEEDVDDDEDAVIDRAIREVWSYYDKKNQQFISKKTAVQFLKDALELYAMRKSLKVKDILAGRSEKDLLEQSYRNITSNPAQVTFNEFEEFINGYDIEEALCINSGPVEITTTSVAMVDTSTIVAKKKGSDLLAIEYRDYPTD